MKATRLREKNAKSSWDRKASVGDAEGGIGRVRDPEPHAAGGISHRPSTTGMLCVSLISVEAKTASLGKNADYGLRDADTK